MGDGSVSAAPGSAAPPGHASSGVAGSSRSWGRRLSRGALATVLVAGAVAVLTASGLPSAPAALVDGDAWLVRGRDLVHASSQGAAADWLLPDALAAGAAASAEVSQDGEVALVVDVAGERAFSIDAVTLEASDPVAVAPDVRPYVGGGQAYLVGDGVVRWLDPATFEEKGSLAVPGTVSATIDGDGILWVLAPRDGSLRKVVGGEVTAEVDVVDPGHDSAITLAGNQPVVHDRDDASLVFVDRRTGRPGDEVQLPGPAMLQGPSSEGDRVWLASEAGTLIGIGPAGDAIEVDVPGASGALRRPEVLSDRVVVASAGGTVSVFDGTGQPVADAPADLPAAAEGDFRTFTKDGVVWFNAPDAGLAGTVDGQGGVHPLEVDEESLARRRQQAPDPETPVQPTRVDTPQEAVPQAPIPATIPATPTNPSGGPPDVEPSPPPTTVAAGERPGATATPTTLPVTTTAVPPTATTVPTTTTTTVPPPQPVPVPDVTGMAVADACAALEAAGLTCSQQPSGTYGSPANTVLGQSPAGGQAQTRGGPVAISFHESAGVTVPAAGTTGSTACGPIEDAGLTCNLIPVYGTDGPTPDEAYGQTPAAGTAVGPGSTVNVEYEARPQAVVWQVDNPANYQLYLTTDAAAADRYQAQGWTKTSLGRVFLEEAPDTWVVYCLQPNGTGSNQSNVYIPGTMPNLPYHEACGGGVLGYAPIDGHPKASRVHPVWRYVAHSDDYYSTADSDPAGLAHQATDPDGYSSVIFSLYDE
jgi:hypothetical protein